LRTVEPRIELTRCYRFPAAHVLRSAELSEADNQRIYGQCANPHGHGHDYNVEITIAGPVDPETGALVPLDWLDRQVDELVIERLGYRLLNEDPWFARRVPTAENIAIFVRETLEKALASRPSLSLVRVLLHETRRNQFEIRVR
jgi:6-pyruvoyltetrahydropterin/6-carboxytetrahydropterin synthase